MPLAPSRTNSSSPRDEKEAPLDTPDLQYLLDDGSVDPVYRAKAMVLCREIQKIGMGKYQWHLFVVAGFGWFVDVTWLVSTGLILPSTINEFRFDGPFLVLASNIGLLCGGIFWGHLSDTRGRRWPFNVKLFIAGVIGVASGGAMNFVVLSSLSAILAVGAGGNVSVDSAIFLEFLPASHQYLLTILASWWCLGQLVTTLIAWPLLVNFSCPEEIPPCTRSSNMGWRYLLFVLGGITLGFSMVRIFVFTLFESPRFLASRDRDAEAVAVVHKLAAYNGTTSTLTVDDLEAAARSANSNVENGTGYLKITHFTHRVLSLFATRKMAWSTVLLNVISGIVGLGSSLYDQFLPYLFAMRGQQFGDGSLYTTYRNQVIISVVCIPSAIFTGWVINQRSVGRRGTLAISTGLAGIFLLASTTAHSSNALLAWNCGYAFFTTIMFSVLSSLPSEIFPTRVRGTGNGLISTTRGVFSIVAPMITLSTNLATSVPVYIAGGLIILVGPLALLLPYEPRGRASI